MHELPDPDWYLDHVLVQAEPGSGADIVVTESAQWRAWWAARLRDVERDFPPLADLAGEQGFVLSSQQLAQRGTARHVARRRVRDGQWSAPQPGVVSVAGEHAFTAGDPGQFVVARRRHAVAAAGAALRNPGHAVSGASAAVLHALPTRHVPGRVELTSAQRANARRGARPATLEPVDAGAWFGVPVTTAARTCVDLARHDRRAGLMATDSALHQRLTSTVELDAALERARRWCGVRQAREIVHFADERAESPLESVVRLALHDSGFPPPELQYLIEVPERRRPFRVDFCWPDRGVILEADGRVKYDGDQNWREKKREALLRPLGFRIERVIWSDVEENWPTSSRYLLAALGL